MLLTIKQAQETWCPMTRMVRYEETYETKQQFVIGGCNTGGLSARAPQSARCISEKCAMWRWSNTRSKKETESFIKENIFLKKTQASRGVKQGYCGLAGQPIET